MEVNVIFPEALSPEQRAVLDDILAKHYDPESGQLRLRQIEERKRVEEALPEAHSYTYSWKGIQPTLEDIRRIKSKVESSIGLDVAFEFSYPDWESVTFTFGRKLTEVEKAKLDEIMREEGSLPLAGGFEGEEVVGSIIATNTRQYVLAPGWYTTNLIEWTQVDPLVDYVLLWSAETYNTGGRTDYYILMDEDAAPIAIGYCGRDAYPEYRIRTAHGARSDVGPGSHNSRVLIHVAAGTTNIWYIVYTIQPMPVVSLVDVVGLLLGIG